MKFWSCNKCGEYYNLEKDKKCWRCRRHRTIEVIQAAYPINLRKWMKTRAHEDIAKECGLR